MTLRCSDKYLLCTYMMGWVGTLVGDGLAGDGSTEVPPPQAFEEDRMTALASALGLVGRI